MILLGLFVSAASEALGKVVEAAPALAEKVLQPLLEALRDQNDPYGDVRMAASEALGKVVEAAPGLAEKVLQPLLEALRDQNDPDGSVRMAASEALGKVVEAAPALAEKVLPHLLEALRDQNDPSGDVRRAASEALGKFSLQQFIDIYWDTQNQALIPLIVPQLYQTPLSVQNIRNSQEQRLILYPSAGQSIPWNKPHEEVQHFVQLIKSNASQGSSSLRTRDAESYVSREVVKAPPAHAAKVIQLLGENMRNEAEYVRSFAIEALGQVLKAAPQQAEQVPEGTFVNQASSDGRTPLMSAAQEGRLELAQFLVDKGADVNQAKSDGWTPLMSAAQEGRLELAQFLVDKGADVNQAKSRR